MVKPRRKILCQMKEPSGVDRIRRVRREEGLSLRHCKDELRAFCSRLGGMLFYVAQASSCILWRSSSPKAEGAKIPRFGTHRSTKPIA